MIILLVFLFKVIEDHFSEANLDERGSTPKIRQKMVPRHLLL